MLNLLDYVISYKIQSIYDFLPTLKAPEYGSDSGEKIFLQVFFEYKIISLESSEKCFGTVFKCLPLLV